MKKLVSLLLALLMILPAAGFAEANDAADIPTAAESRLNSTRRAISAFSPTNTRIR